MKKIIQDTQGMLYWFNGEKIERIGEPEKLTAIYEDILLSIGENIYFCSNGSLIHVVSRVELISINDEVRSKQFFIQADNLMFQENANSAPIQLSKAFMDEWKDMLLPDDIKGFAVRDIKTEEFKEYIYAIDVNKCVCTRLGYFLHYPRENSFFWNGFMYESKTDDEGKLLMVAQAWHLLYKTEKYLLLQAGNKCFALFEDGKYMEFPNVGTIIKTPSAVLLSCRRACWHLLDEMIAEIVNLGYEGESYQICNDGSILATEIINYGSGNDPEVAELMRHYNIRNGHYTDVSGEY